MFYRVWNGNWTLQKFKEIRLEKAVWHKQVMKIRLTKRRMKKKEENKKLSQPDKHCH